MNPRILFDCSASLVVFVISAMLVVSGVLNLLKCLLDSFKETKTEPAISWIFTIVFTIATICFLFFSMLVMYFLAIHVKNCFADFVYNRDQRRGFDHAPSQDDPQRGIETLDRTRRLIRELEEERKQILQDLYKMFPSMSYTSQEVGSKSEDCTICLGDFVEGEICWVLPSCKHMFHSSCIDRWLMTRFSCPVCRNCVFPG